MKESLERQDSAGLFVLLDRWDRAELQLREHRARFDAAYGRAAANITEPGEAEVVQAIGRNRDDYYRRFDRFLLDARGNGATGQRLSRPAVDEYFRQLEPLFTELRGNCDRLLTLNQNAMRRKAAEASTLARRWFLTTLATAFALVVGGIAFAILLSNSIVRPVRQLTDATSRVAAGDLDTVVDVRSGDELGVLATQFNEMAGRIRQLRQSDLGKILVAQQTAEAAVDSLYDPVIVTDAEGRVQRINRAARATLRPRGRRCSAGRPGRHQRSAAVDGGAGRARIAAEPWRVKRARPSCRWSLTARNDRSGSAPRPCAMPTTGWSAP